MPRITLDHQTFELDDQPPAAKVLIRRMRSERSIGIDAPLVIMTGRAMAEKPSCPPMPASDCIWPDVSS